MPFIIIYLSIIFEIIIPTRHEESRVQKREAVHKRSCSSTGLALQRCLGTFGERD